MRLPDRSAGNDGKARAAVRRRSGYVRGVGILDYRLVLGQIIHGCFSIVGRNYAGYLAETISNPSLVLDFAVGEVSLRKGYNNHDC